MPQGEAICQNCGTDLKDVDEAAEGFATFHSPAMGGSDRADLHIECPECGEMIESEINIITFNSG